MTTPFGYNPFVLERCLNMPDVTFTDMIYHFLLAKLIECDNNKEHLSKRIGIPIRNLRTKIGEIEARGYPMPAKNNGAVRWTKEEKEEYENRIGFDSKKRVIRPPTMFNIIPKPMRCDMYSRHGIDR